MRKVAAVLALAALAVVTSPAPAALASTTTEPVVVVGIPGLQWKDVSANRTPALWRLARAGSVGSLSIRSAADVTCQADGWLTVGAGNRVKVPGPCGAVPPVSVQGAGATVGGFAAITKVNHGLGFGAVPGILASAMTSAGAGCVSAVGAPAALGAADRTGTVAVFAATLSATALGACPVTLVSGPTVVTPADSARADALVAAVDAARPPGSVLIVLGLADTDPSERAHLHVAIASGGPYGPGRLSSQSTRRAPYVQLIDVTPTLLGLSGASAAPGVAAAVDGQPWRQVGHRPSSLASLVEADRSAGAVRSAVLVVVTFLVVLAVAGMVATVLAWRRGTGHRPALWLLFVALSGPVASYLANLTPWLRSDHATLTALGVTALVAVLIGSVAHALALRRSAVLAAGAVTGLTVVVLVADVVSGSRLQLDSVLGYSPLVAGRFMGFGNVAFGVLGAAAVLCATSIAMVRGRGAWPVVVPIAVVVVAADGVPMWGSDIGGVLSLVPAFAVLTLLCARKRLSVGRAVLIGAAAVAVVFLLGLLDYARPAASRTHLGRFVGKVLHGGAWTVLDRKAHAGVDLLTANVGTLIVPVIVGVVVWLVLRPRPRLARAYEDHPELRFGLISLVVLALIGLVVNDSGLAIPAVAVLLGVPYVLAVLLHDTAGNGTEPPRDDPRVLP